MVVVVVVGVLLLGLSMNLLNFGGLVVRTDEGAGAEAEEGGTGAGAWRDELAAATTGLEWMEDACSLGAESLRDAVSVLETRAGLRCLLQLLRCLSPGKAPPHGDGRLMLLLRSREQAALVRDI